MAVFVVSMRKERTFIMIKKVQMATPFNMVQSALRIVSRNQKTLKMCIRSVLYRRL